jgi:hypothetical protein
MSHCPISCWHGVFVQAPCQRFTFGDFVATDCKKYRKISFGDGVFFLDLHDNGLVIFNSARGDDLKFNLHLR